jgi:hypothetical protein
VNPGMPDMAKPQFMQQQYAFAAHIRDPQNSPAPADVEDRRMAIYRELFYNNVEGFLSNSFPVLRKLLDDDAWHQLAREFFAKYRCHSPLFLEIPREFMAYLEELRGDCPGDLPFMRELAHYEWVELALSVSEAEPAGAVDPAGDPLDSRPVLASTAWPLSYRYPVHRISPDFVPEEPGDQPTYLLVYRDDDDEVGFIELNPVSARLFALLQEQTTSTGREVLEQIAAELQHPNPGVVVDGGHQILQDWRRRGIVLGSAC